jgi:Ca2+:H+ antiporter
MTRGLLVGAAALLLTALGGALATLDGPPAVTTGVNGVALGLVAWAIAVGTDAISERLGPGATGVVQSTIGNLPGFFIVLFALADGEVVVAQTSIVGGVFANGLLLLGVAVLAGALRSPSGQMTFAPRLPNDTATLLLLSSFVIVLLGLSDTVADNASEHQVEISVVGAVCLLGVYATWLVGYLRSPADARPRLRRSAAAPARPLSMRAALVLLALASVAAALVSSWFVDALGPAADDLGISRSFAGLVVAGIAGYAIPNVVGVTLAGRGESDLAISVIKNSVAQLNAVVFPLAVLASLLFAEQMTFVLTPVMIGALALSAVAIWQITGDGRAMVFEGWALVALYVVVATLVWYE